MQAQSLSVKRAEVEFHNFASLGQPERALSRYAEQNHHRGGLIRKYREFIGPMTPFAELGANAGHSSYMLANEFGAGGFALDISADALRYGAALQDAWNLERAPIRVAGDAANLPFADSSLRFVAAFQMLSQFMDIEAIFLEVKRVLAPGGVFFFAEEPLRRMLSLRVYRAPYYDLMKPWERKLHDWGLLGYFVRDVIGARQEESFGIRQNHAVGLKDWDRLMRKHFEEIRYDLFVPERGWGERVVKRAAVRLDPYGSEWRAARLLGGTLAAFCRKAGEPAAVTFDESRFEAQLRCPDCRGPVARDAADTLRCRNCSYTAANEGGVYNLLPSADRAELYPGDRADIIDFSLPGHEARLGAGWHQLEGVFGNRYRWIGPEASARLQRVKTGPQRLRVRGHVQKGHPIDLRIHVNGRAAGEWKLDAGLFIVEADVNDAPEYDIVLKAGPEWRAPGDNRSLTVNLSMIRLAPAGESE